MRFYPWEKNIIANLYVSSICRLQKLLFHFILLVHEIFVGVELQGYKGRKLGTNYHFS